MQFVPLPPLAEMWRKASLRGLRAHQLCGRVFGLCPRKCKAVQPSEGSAKAFAPGRSSTSSGRRCEEETSRLHVGAQSCCLQSHGSWLAWRRIAASEHLCHVGCGVVAVVLFASRGIRLGGLRWLREGPKCREKSFLVAQAPSRRKGRDTHGSAEFVFRALDT